MLKKIGIPIVLVVVLILVIILLKKFPGMTHDKGNMDTAVEHYFALDLSKTEAVLDRIIAVEGANSEAKADALVFQAKIAWKFYRDEKTAREKLSQADDLKVKTFEIRSLRSRVERESTAYKRAVMTADKAIEAAQSEKERIEGATLLGQAIWEDAQKRITSAEALDPQLLKRGIFVLRDCLTHTPGYPEPSRLLLGLALLDQDGETAFWAWKSYFQVLGENPPQGILSGPYLQLKPLLLGWQQRPLSHEEGARLIEGLGQSRFYGLGKLMKQVFYPEDSFTDNLAVHEILLYADFIERVKKETDEYYRMISLGKQDEKAFQEALYHQAEEFWKSLTFSGECPVFSKELFAREMKKRFGVHMSIGSTGNYSGTVLIMGHLIDEQKRKIEQYGYNSDFEFLLYDMMVSNCYSSWFWDGMANIGGWGTADAISMVRSGSVERQYRKWWRIRDKNERQKQEDIISERLEKEEKEIAQNSSAPINVLSSRMEQIALDKLVANIEDSGVDAEEIPKTFLQQYNAFLVGSTVFAHEGRHAIDQKFFADEFAGWNAAEREFRAKLSEIVFSSDPYLALAGLLNQVPNDSGHGQANLKIREILIDWMHAHNHEIEALDPKRPMLTQAYLLSNEQIRDCYTKADPLAKR